MPIKSSVPAIRFDIEIEKESGTESILSIEGWLYTVYNEPLVASLIEYREQTGDYNRGSLGAMGSSYDNAIIKMEKENISLIAFLEKEAIDFIEESRYKDRYNDVHLKLRVKFTTLNSNTRLLMPIFRKLSDVGASGAVGAEQMMIYNLDTREGQNDNAWLLSGAGNPYFINVKELTLEFNHDISSSDWIKKYSEMWKIGQYFLIDLPLPLMESKYLKNKPLGERLIETIKSFSKMEENFKRGEWTEVIKESRPIYELLRDKDSILSIFTDSGYTEEMASSLYESIRNLFDYASKYIHKLERTPDKAIMPQIKAEKEDAYLIYASSATLINLLNRKISKISEK